MSFIRRRALLQAAGAVVALAACSSGQPSAATEAPASSADSAFDPSAPPLSFTSDAAGKVVSFRLVAAHDASDSAFNFNGYQKGRLAITVPEGWRVTISCQNKGPLNHSCGLVRSINDSAPAIDGAASPNPSSGTPAGQTDTFTFTAAGSGTYRLACLVPGHEQAGMWDSFTVTPSGSPSARLQT